MVTRLASAKMEENHSFSFLLQFQVKLREHLSDHDAAHTCPRKSAALRTGNSFSNREYL